MKKLLYIFLTFIFCLFLISIFSLDIKIENLFFNEETKRWSHAGYYLWYWFYEYGPYIGKLVGLFAFITLIIATIKKSKSLQRKSISALLVLLLGPGLLVQTLKITWGRPRPRETIEFNGKYEFRTPFQPDFKKSWQTSTCNSYPSGHAAIAFYTLVIYFFMLRKKYILISSVSYGILMSIARMVQGAHYLSDVVSSFFIVYMCIELFEFLLLKKQKI